MAKKAQQPPKSFEDGLRELEQILAEIENGDLGLEESLVKYERGNFLIRHCRDVLAGAEKQIELLSATKDGAVVAKTFNPPDEPDELDDDTGTEDFER